MKTSLFKVYDAKLIKMCLHLSSSRNKLHEFQRTMICCRIQTWIKLILGACVTSRWSTFFKTIFQIFLVISAAVDIDCGWCILTGWYWLWLMYIDWLIVTMVDIDYRCNDFGWYIDCALFYRLVDWIDWLTCWLWLL